MRACVRAFVCFTRCAAMRVILMFDSGAPLYACIVRWCASLEGFTKMTTSKYDQQAFFRDCKDMGADEC